MERRSGSRSLVPGWTELANGLGFDPRSSRAGRREEPVGKVCPRRRRRLRGRRNQRQAIRSFCSRLARVCRRRRRVANSDGADRGRSTGSTGSAESGGDASRDDPGSTRSGRACSLFRRLEEGRHVGSPGIASGPRREQPCRRPGHERLVDSRRPGPGGGGFAAHDRGARDRQLEGSRGGHQSQAR